MNLENILELRKFFARWLLEHFPNEKDCATVVNELEETILIYLRIMNDLKRSGPDVHKNYLSGISERERIFKELEGIKNATLKAENNHSEKD
jgi:hypothetical protein